MRPAKTQISLRIYTVWSESSVIACAFYSLQAIQRGMNEKPCYTWWVYRLIWVFAGRPSSCRFCQALVQIEVKKWRAAATEIPSWNGQQYNCQVPRLAPVSSGLIFYFSYIAVLKSTKIIIIIIISWLERLVTVLWPAFMVMISVWLFFSGLWYRIIRKY